MDYEKRRCVEIADYMLSEKITLREAAAHFGLSKTTIHTEVTDRLRDVDYTLYKRVRALLDANLEARSYRGGRACVKKYPFMYKWLHQRVSIKSNVEG